MSPPFSGRLPGVYFEIETSPPAETLPRMDIALFVGFAGRGPINVPVPIEDARRFREIYGPPVPLAWNEDRREWEYPLLGPAIDLFFRNGGLRCWVMRAADAAAAETSTFEVPGLLTANGNPATLRARCPGSWADGLRIGTRRRSLPLEVRGQAKPQQIELAVTQEPLVPGDLLRFARMSGGEVWAILTKVEVTQTGQRVFWHTQIGDLPTSPDAIRFGERVTFDLLVWQEKSLVARMDDLGFTAAHPRFWARLPTDDELFRPTLSGAPPLWRDLWAEAADPRFPLAGPAPASSTGVNSDDPWEQAYFLPDSMPSVADPERTTLPAPTSIRTSLERDGLGVFSSRLFVDDRLDRASSETMMAEAELMAHVLQLPVNGLHATLLNEEITLLSVPDAVQPGWKKTEESPLGAKPLGAPELGPVAPVPIGSQVSLNWTVVPDALEYEVQECLEVAFASGVRSFVVSDLAWERAVTEACPARHYFRVRARGVQRVGPWSITRGATLPIRDFAVCGAFELEAPWLSEALPSSPPNGFLQMVWSPVEGATRYTLEVAADAAFEVAEHREITGEQAEVRLDRQQIRYYRVRAEGFPGAGPWSNTIWTNPSPIRWVSAAVGEFDRNQMLAVHLAMLRVGAARGDVLAVISLPRHFRDDLTLDYLRELGGYLSEPRPSQRVRTESGILRMPGEDRALGFGVIYHPWLWAFQEDQPLAVSPDGAACGKLAERALKRGVWIAPANIPLTGVFAIEPNFDEAAWNRFWSNRINLVRPDPRGFLTLSAETLSVDADTQPIPVRRLLMLLRRLAVREGHRMVFAPNQPRFQATVKRRFELLLGDLYARGAFAGETAAAGFQVVLPRELNDDQARDKGRIVIDLKVAPSQPLTFLTIRLVQHGGELSIQAGA